MYASHPSHWHGLEDKFKRWQSILPFVTFAGEVSAPDLTFTVSVSKIIPAGKEKIQTPFVLVLHLVCLPSFGRNIPNQSLNGKTKFKIGAINHVHFCCIQLSYKTYSSCLTNSLSPTTHGCIQCHKHLSSSTFSIFLPSTLDLLIRLIK